MISKNVNADFPFHHKQRRGSKCQKTKQHENDTVIISVPEETKLLGNIQNVNVQILPDQFTLLSNLINSVCRSQGPTDQNISSRWLEATLSFERFPRQVVVYHSHSITVERLPAGLVDAVDGPELIMSLYSTKSFSPFNKKCCRCIITVCLMYGGI